MRVDLTYFVPTGQRYGTGHYYTTLRDKQAIYNEIAGMRSDGDLPNVGMPHTDLHVLVSIPTLPRTETFLLVWSGPAPEAVPNAA